VLIDAGQVKTASWQCLTSKKRAPWSGALKITLDGGDGAMQPFLARAASLAEVLWVLHNWIELPVHHSRMPSVENFMYCFSFDIAFECVGASFI
jgi:hypothetical protein